MLVPITSLPITIQDRALALLCVSYGMDWSAAVAQAEAEQLAATQVNIASIVDALVVAVDAARIKAAGDTRWLTALETGYDWLLTQETVAYDRASHELTVPSATVKGKNYRSNGQCSCQAFGVHKACWHRASSRLVRRALELQDTVAQPRVSKAQIVAEMAECFV